MNGHLDTVKFLVTVPSIKVNASDRLGLTPLHHAAMSGHLSVVKFLVTVPSIQVNAVSRKSRPRHAVPSIQVNDAGGNMRGSTTLHVAVHSGHVDIVNFLVTVPGIKVDAVDRKGWTALHLAAANGYLDTVTW